uniref:Inosine triphosphate pyrophosphatase n=1 Tax=Attheya septentrionalis TaxID=420275 RepID=A0A7S2U835_9STRA|mmetsp:Transcript_12336/g.22390  ORF Transcript_12336/g.22390 Transcript_12336/m.22390 type:complete len:303 (+) Transcript_12336:125-1033(+)
MTRLFVAFMLLFSSFASRLVSAHRNRGLRTYYFTHPLAFLAGAPCQSQQEQSQIVKTSNASRRISRLSFSSLSRSLIRSEARNAKMTSYVAPEEKGVPNPTADEKLVITFVTGNKKKLEEVKRILGGDGSEELPFDITNEKIDLPELQGHDPVEIAIEKCKVAAAQVQGPVMIEDTSLCFNALNGLPGPYIKWFLDKCGHSGLNKMLVGFDDKTAYAQTVVAFTLGVNQEVHVFDGRTNGRIVQARGPLDFGWDPIFEPSEGSGHKTYAEMEKTEKDAISHRGRSFAKLQAFLISDKTDNIK